MSILHSPEILSGENWVILQGRGCKSVTFFLFCFVLLFYLHLMYICCLFSWHAPFQLPNEKIQQPSVNEGSVWPPLPADAKSGNEKSLKSEQTRKEKQSARVTRVVSEKRQEPAIPLFWNSRTLSWKFETCWIFSKHCRKRFRPKNDEMRIEWNKT